MIWRVILIWFALTQTAAALDVSIENVRKNYHPGLPNPSNLTNFIKLTNIPIAQAYVLGLPWCAFTAVTIFNIMMRREPTTAEAWRMFGSCIVPVLGGLVVGDMFAKHPEWNIPGKVQRIDFGIGSQS